MAFKIIRNDITKVRADAIVNTANPNPAVGRGTDTAVYKAAGYSQLLKARHKIGVINRGEAVWTESFNLKNHGVKYIIHTVGTFYLDGKNGETDILRSCYSKSLNLAKELGCKSIAIPLLATGCYAFPKELGLQIAVDEISRFLLENEIDVTLVVYDKKSYLISEKLFDDIQDFLDENYTGEDYFDFCSREEEFEEDFEPDTIEASTVTSTIGGPPPLRSASLRLLNSERICNSKVDKDFKAEEKASVDIDDFISKSKGEMNFQDTLQHLIAEKNVGNSEIYSKAFIDRKFFSKIISHKNYVPKKMTVMALGLALELDLRDFEDFLASAGYAFMPSSKFDLIVKYCVINGIYNLIQVDMILYGQGETCFATDK